VIDSRGSRADASIRRRRECTECGYRFTTVEEVLRESLRVIKRDATREDFSRDKLFRSVRKAIEGRPVDLEQVEMMLADLVDQLEREFGFEIPTRAIGEEIMNRLRRVDQMAFVRFAIAYKDIEDIAELDRELEWIRS